MVAASPLSGCPLVKPATQNRRWPSEGKGNTIGSTVGIIMNHWGASPCCADPPVSKAHHRIDTNTPRNATESYPHPPHPPRSSGVTVVGPTTAIATHTHTHTQPRKTIVLKDAAKPLAPAGHQDPTSRRCGHARRQPTPTPRGDAQTKHRAKAIVLCAPVGDPHVHQITTSKETKPECSHSSAYTLGPVHHMARTHQTDDKSKGRKKKGVHQQRVLC